MNEATMQPMPEDPKLDLAKILYSTYCEAVGGTAYDGRPLPSADEFFADASKKRQSDAWLAVCKRTMEITIKPLPNDLSTVEDEIYFDKFCRRDLDVTIKIVRALPASRERSICITKLQEAVMWLGMDLKRIGDANPGFVKPPYPDSKNPDSNAIAPTADGLKL